MIAYHELIRKSLALCNCDANEWSITTRSEWHTTDCAYRAWYAREQAKQREYAGDFVRVEMGRGL